jgi:hypothetical protein
LDAREGQGITVGACTVTIDRSAHEQSARDVTMALGRITDAGVVRLKEVGGLSMCAPGQDAWIRWAEGVSSRGWGTYELRSRPIAWGHVEYGNVPAEISRDCPDWMGQGPHRRPIMRIQYADAEADPDDAVVESAIDESTGDEHGARHRVKATTPIELGRWYHIAAVHGAYGMRLFVNGRLEGSDESGGAATPSPPLGVPGVGAARTCV